MQGELVASAALAQLEGSVCKAVNRVPGNRTNTHSVFTAKGANVGLPVQVDLVKN